MQSVSHSNISPQAPQEVLIVGAGPAGLGMACALADAGIASCVLEANSLASIEQPAEDGREIALTHKGIAILQALGQWQDLPAAEIAPLRRAHVFNGDSPDHLAFDAEGSGREVLGSLVSNHWLRRVAYQGALKRQGLITIRADSRVCGLEIGAEAASLTLSGGERLTAQLLIAADSRFSNIRRQAGVGAQMRDFGRSVIVCRIKHAQANQGIALECFHYGHTLAILPLNGDCSSLVLTLPADRATAMMAWDEAQFMQWVSSELRGRLGDLEPVGARHLYPLVATYAHRFAAQRLALVGDAAVGMHPVTAHGYNFGLYGLSLLAGLLAEAKKKGQDLGGSAALQRYASEHRRNTWAIYQGTNAVVKLFTDERPAARLLRRGVLQAAQALPPVRAAISAQLTGRQPGLLRQLRSLVGAS
ncbi:5-demethoxyubiquinol-8 5-hydroxylase UbiM [Roseateles oligotrophus]|uniref:5-demethoxyubiquinol-8 5-hydroxylase UbiM n=1 Tax=Roseateles oligotrophus TaxID=1769250 RepID=A0ABT2YGP6_9BURK|nr:5-demethoxyubiquinol-8 5-hydroxylase UbiM [Roseateles oligotrophus]MCV2369160.1 5-demethoxyubiquinol-8 5-hydroxylase UbiM [Roseateles oligotrophus]